MNVRRQPLLLPELGLGSTAVVTSLWLVREGAAVTAGDRLLEVVAGVVCVDLSAPVSGILAEQLVGEDEEVCTGQTLAWLEERDVEP